MRLVNVRLDDADLQRVRTLREQGLELSQLVRNAIDLAAIARGTPPLDLIYNIIITAAQSPDEPARTRGSVRRNASSAFRKVSAARRLPSSRPTGRTLFVFGSMSFPRFPPEPVRAS